MNTWVQIRFLVSVGLFVFGSGISTVEATEYEIKVGVGGSRGSSKPSRIVLLL